MYLHKYNWLTYKNNKMKTLSIFIALAIFASCSNDFNQEKPVKGIETEVNFNMAKDFIEICNLSEKTGGGTTTLDPNTTLIGFDVKKKVGETYEPYAYALIDDIAKAKLKVTGGSTYKIRHILIPNGKESIHKVGELYKDPFSRNTNNLTECKDYFIISGGDYFSNIFDHSFISKSNSIFKEIFANESIIKIPNTVNPEISLKTKRIGCELQVTLNEAISKDVTIFLNNPGSSFTNEIAINAESTSSGIKNIAFPNFANYLGETPSNTYTFDFYIRVQGNEEMHCEKTLTLERNKLHNLALDIKITSSGAITINLETIEGETTIDPIEFPVEL